MSNHLFILCPPFCGSTLLWKLISTSDNVSALPEEGQLLPEVKDIMRDKPWQRDHEMPWEQIRSVWETYWEAEKPLLVEKSPPNIIRAKAIKQHFDPARFIIMARNPYAHAEGLMRHNEWPVERAGNFAMMCLCTQTENTQLLPGSPVLTYESLVAGPKAACARLAEFLPELGELDHNAHFEVHSVEGTASRPITDFNAQKIAALSAQALDTLNAIFLPHRDVMRFWGYQLFPSQRTLASQESNSL